MICLLMTGITLAIDEDGIDQMFPGCDRCVQVERGQSSLVMTTEDTSSATLSS